MVQYTNTQIYKYIYTAVIKFHDIAITDSQKLKLSGFEEWIKEDVPIKRAPYEDMVMSIAPQIVKVDPISTMKVTKPVDNNEAKDSLEAQNAVRLNMDDSPAPDKKTEQVYAQGQVGVNEQYKQVAGVVPVQQQSYVGGAGRPGGEANVTNTGISGGGLVGQTQMGSGMLHEQQDQIRFQMRTKYNAPNAPPVSVALPIINQNQMCQIMAVDPAMTPVIYADNSSQQYASNTQNYGNYAIQVQQHPVQQHPVQQHPVQQHQMQQHQIQQQPMQRHPMPVNQIPVNQIPVNQIPVNQIPVNQIPVNQIPVNQIPVNQIQSSRIINNHIVNNQIPKVHMLNGQMVQTNQMPSMQMTTQQMTNNKMRINPNNNNQIPVKKMYNNQIPVKQMSNNQIPANQMVNHQIPANQMANYPIPINQIPTNNISNIHMNANQMASHQIPANQMSNYQIPVKQISNLQIPANQMSNNQIPASNISNIHMNATQVANYQVPVNQVSNNQISNNIVDINLNSRNANIPQGPPSSKRQKLDESSQENQHEANKEDNQECGHEEAKEGQDSSTEQPEKKVNLRKRKKARLTEYKSRMIILMDDDDVLNRDIAEELGVFIFLYI